MWITYRVARGDVFSGVQVLLLISMFCFDFLAQQQQQQQQQMQANNQFQLRHLLQVAVHRFQTFYLQKNI